MHFLLQQLFVYDSYSPQQSRQLDFAHRLKNISLFGRLDEGLPSNNN